MARDSEIEQRLWLWAERLKSGDGSGYPVKSTLHPDWSPPPQGMRPGMKVCTAQRDHMHELVEMLPDSLKATVVAHYLLRMPDADAAEALGCATATVGERIQRAHRLLKLMAGERGIFATSG